MTDPKPSKRKKKSHAPTPAKPGFATMAIHAGVTCPITNPLVPEVAFAVLAADLTMGRDQYGMSWIKAYRKRQK